MKNFFDESYIYFYKDFLTEDGTLEEVKFIEKYIKKDAAILDACCGFGRHTIILNRDGFHCIGIDNCKENIVRAQATASNNGLEKEIFSDINIFECNEPEQYDCVILACNTLGLFLENDERLLKKVSYLLKSNGILIFDVMNMRYLNKYLSKRQWLLKEDNILLVEYNYETELNLLEINELRIIDNVRTKYSCKTNVYDKDNISFLLNKCNFNVTEVFGGYDNSEFTDDSRDIIIVAEKRN